jgi:hypothetical protein
VYLLTFIITTLELVYNYSVDAYAQLKQLVDGYKADLAKNKTLSDPGTFTIDGKKQTSKVTKINNLNIQTTIAPSAIQPPYVAAGVFCWRN